MAASFTAAWDSILARKARLPARHDLLWHRALHGAIKPIVRGGQVVATVHQPDNRAALRLLNRMDKADRSRARMRARLGRDGSSR